MKKQTKKKIEAKKEPIKILPDLFDSCEEIGVGLLVIGILLSIFLLAIFWSGNSVDNPINFHGIDPWFMFGLFLIVAELVFIWIANNTMYSTDMPEVTVFKIISLISSAILTVWILSGFILIRYILSNISLEAIMSFVSFFGIGVIVIVVGYLYLKANQWIAKKVSAE